MAILDSAIDSQFSSLNDCRQRKTVWIISLIPCKDENVSCWLQPLEQRRSSDRQENICKEQSRDLHV